MAKSGMREALQNVDSGYLHVAAWQTCELAKPVNMCTRHQYCVGLQVEFMAAVGITREKYFLMIHLVVLMWCLD